ncbi:uncharacterized protein [Salminus brasiliensis]|uniref:uncharacterized protein n=1 Tax=Salminus brasiliensis TaxID=930266 RepID=UPI003B82ED1C
MDMLVLCGVLLMFSGSAEGLITVGSNCISNQPCLFYGALGRPLYLQLPSESELRLKKIISETVTDPILTFKNQTIRHKHPDPRWQFVTENRTMIISRAEKDDSGRYTLETFDSGGTDRGKYQFQLIIEAEVSSVKITYSCWSSVKRSVYCSSDGDQLSFSWTLNVSPHEHQLTDGNQTLLLDKGSTGTISCSVENHVSHGSQTIDLQECPGLIAVGSDCTSNQPCLFYGALERPLYLQLPSEYELKLKKNSGGTTTETTILAFKNQTIRYKHPDPRWQFVTENRTMIISRAEKDDSGRYSLETYDSGGTDRGKYQFQLIIEAEVSSVKITYSCWTSVNRRVSCSSDGDQLSFSWTLNVSPHEHQLTDGNRTLLLDKDSTGNISCSVENHVSKGSKTNVLPLPSSWCPGLIAVGSDCISNQPCLFYGALGRPLYLQLPSESELKLKKNSSGNTSDPILTFKKPKIIQKHPDPRWQFVTENRTMIISRAEKNHSGNYSLETYDSGGTYRGKYQFQLIIEAEVSSVKITYSCWSSVDRSVYCSSDGDQLSFSWTLNVDSHGHRLTDGNRTLLLDKDSTGNISCSIENHVSKGSKTIELPLPSSWCPEQFVVFVLVWALEIIVLLSLLAGFHIHARIIRKQSIKQNIRTSADKVVEEKEAL